MILLGFLASSAYDESTKVTLQMGMPKKVGDTTLTFTNASSRAPGVRRRRWRSR